MTNEKSVRDTYNQIAADFSATRNRSWPEWEQFIEHMSKPGKILDVGCGNGRLYEFLRSNDKTINYEGLDVSEGLIEEAKKKYPNAKFVVGDARSLPHQDNSIDYLFSIAVVHHFKNESERLKVLTEMKRVLKDGGMLFLMVWNLWENPKYSKNKSEAIERSKSGETSPQDFIIPWGDQKIPRYYYAFKKDEFRSILEKAGFKITKLCYANRESSDVEPEKGFNLVAICQK